MKIKFSHQRDKVFRLFDKKQNKNLGQLLTTKQETQNNEVLKEQNVISEGYDKLRLTI